MTDTDGKAVLDLVGPGDIVGTPSLVGLSSSFQYKALTHCKAATFGTTTGRSIALGEFSSQST